MSELDLYLDYIREDYRKWIKGYAAKDICNGMTSIRQEMLDEFVSSVRAEEGSKYIKVITGSSVHSFIVKKDGGKWKAGDILKAASWRSPATNFKRGNILEKNYGGTTWTGAL